MSDVRIGYSDYVRYVLHADTSVTSYTMFKEPIGWSNDDLEITRHKKYHGIFTTFTNKLAFIGDAKSYIQTAYNVGGINTVLRLRKEIKRDIDGEVKWVVRYTCIADFTTMSVKGNRLNIKFNSNDLAELLKSHESDDFEIERPDSIDGKPLVDLATNITSIQGRDLLITGESKTAETEAFQVTDAASTPRTEVVAKGMERHDAVTKLPLEVDKTAGNMFFNFNAQTHATHQITVKWDLQFSAMRTYLSFPATVNCNLEKYLYNPGGGSYGIVTSQNLLSTTESGEYSLQGQQTFSVDQYNSFAISLNSATSPTTFKIHKWQIVVYENTRVEPSTDLNFVFVHDLLERLLYIITGRETAFYSKILGRTGIIDTLGNPKYVETGEFGLIGVISGLWARGFKKNTTNYKSLTISTKDVLDSLKSVFNIGMGIETVNFEERVRVEDLKYFYREEVVVKLPFQINDVERRVDKDLFFSGLEFGYEKGGEYEDYQGLNEPIGKTEWVTPIRKSVKKYQELSKIRADEVELEKTRRKPQSEFENEDTKGDDSSWWLDLIGTEVSNSYKQREYSDDRLQSLPTGILSPETWRSFLFTPLRMMLRHAWVFRAGLEPYLDKHIRYISSKSNTGLSMHFDGEANALRENEEKILVRNIERSRVLPEITTFKHPVDDDLMDLIVGTTTVIVNGKEEEIPNYYFKFEYINENGEIERGYLLNLKPNKTGEFKMQKANENLI